MFRFLFSKRGKGNISPPLETQQRNAQITTQTIGMPASRTFEVLRPVLIVSAFIGYTHKRYRVQGIIGGFIWFTMLLAHGALDFLAARQVYTYGWASVSLSLFILCFVCTIFANKKMLPWLEKGMMVLEGDKRYPKTLERCAKVFKVRKLSSCLTTFIGYLSLRNVKTGGGEIQLRLGLQADPFFLRDLLTEDANICYLTRFSLSPHFSYLSTEHDRSMHGSDTTSGDRALNH